MSQQPLLETCPRKATWEESLSYQVGLSSQRAQMVSLGHGVIHFSVFLTKI